MKLHRKLIVSILTLVLVVATFTTSTYAWLLNSTEVNISGFDFQALGGQGFMLSVDDVNYTNNITQAKIKEAILYSYGDGEYEFYSNSLVRAGQTTPLTESEINTALSSLELRPMTSENGYEFEGLGSTYEDYKSNCIEFSLYMKTESNNTTDNQTYNIYLYGGNTYTGADGNLISPTKINSENDEVQLFYPMTSIRGEHTFDDHGKLGKITVGSVNAIRYSIGEETTLTTTDPESGTITNSIAQVNTQIFEPYNGLDMGSYATDYKSNNDVLDPNRVYDSSVNAMFTYYNNIIGESNTDARLKALSYEDKKEFLDSVVRYNVTNTANLEQGYIGDKIATISSGQGSKKIVFRFWLEGWDADCFAGIAQSINVNLTFVSEEQKN